MVSVELMSFFQGSDVLVRHLLSNSKEAGWLEGAAATSERSSLRSDTIALHCVPVRHLRSNSKEAGWSEGAAATSERSSLRSDTTALHCVLVRHLRSNSKKAGWFGVERAQ